MAKKNETTNVNIIPSDLSSQQTSIRGTMNRATSKYRQAVNSDDEKKKRELNKEKQQAYDLLVKDVVMLGEMIGCV